MENLDALLEKIRTDGVDAAKQEAADIVAKAQKEAAETVAKAKAEAKAERDRAKADAERLAQGAEATIRQAARDVLLKLGQDIEALFARTLGGAVDEALANGTTVAGLVESAVKAYIKDGEVTIEAAPGLAEALKARLARQGEATVVTNAQMGTGFKVRLAGGRVEHDFSGEAVREALAGLLRPQLAKLLEA